MINRPSTFASDLREGAYTGAFPVVAVGYFVLLLRGD